MTVTDTVAPTEAPIMNAGLRLWHIQKEIQGTGLCVGIDPHFDENMGIGADFYRSRVDPSKFDDATAAIYAMVDVLAKSRNGRSDFANVDADVLVGLYQYFVAVIDAAWECGIRVFKPQASFFERFQPFGPFILHLLCKHFESKGESYFLIMDVKRGDIFSTMEAYFAAYLSDNDQEVYPGVNGLYGADAMTVTTWMGTDVLTSGLSWFERGKGAVVVTRSSNPSGWEMQELPLSASDSILDWLHLSVCSKIKQMLGALKQLIGLEQMAYEMMLYQTELFSKRNGLNQQGVSPIFSVMGATVKMSRSFRRIRPGGIALVPAFGHQGGRFCDIENLIVRAPGPLQGHWGILSASRSMCFCCHEKYGGQGDPRNLRQEMRRAIMGFRVAEKQAYADAGVDFPFAGHPLAP